MERFHWCLADETSTGSFRTYRLLNREVIVSRTTSAVVRYLLQVTTGPYSELSDTELLERFIVQADETAFELIVRRHGPMVLGVCRRVLGDTHDAEDAFQATFLVLVRKASSLQNRNALGPWLYGVAGRTALGARAARSLRRGRQREVVDVAVTDSLPGFIWDELGPVLDQEVGRLPEKYRTPFVLYHLQGLSYDEIERRLGSPRGTVATRLSRARARLQTALSNRGVTLPAGGLAALLVGNTAQAVPLSLVSSTVKAAAAFAVAPIVGGAVSAPVVALVNATLKYKII
jgi:RNA polymerase sigma factor (sigma-70 family)